MNTWRKVLLVLIAICWCLILLMQINIVIARHCMLGLREFQETCNKKASDEAGLDACLAKGLNWISVCYGPDPAHLGGWHWTHREETT